MNERLDPRAGWQPPAAHPERDVIVTAAGRLRDAVGPAPELAVILGSGLGVVASSLERSARTTYQALGLPAPGIEGHAGEICVGELAGRRVALVSGRVHIYEGRPVQVLARIVRVLHLWGVRGLVVTASVGGIDPALAPGALVDIEDVINLMGASPLMGPAWGHRFPDMGAALDPTLRARVAAAAAAAGVDLPAGVYAAMHGPAFETPAEIRMLRLLGARVVGMSVAPEVLAAAEVGLPVAGVALVSNPAAGVGTEQLVHEDVLRAGAIARDQVVRLLTALVGGR
jgi:purine-nucleoside phosphorylase